MTIRNHEGFSTYDQYAVGDSKGQIHSDAKAKRFYNPLLGQSQTFQFATIATGTPAYEVTVTTPGGRTYGPYAYTGAATEAANDQSDGIATMLNAVGALRSLVVISDDGSGEITFAFRNTKLTYTVTIERTDAGAGTTVDTVLAAIGTEHNGVEAQAVGGSNKVVGHFVVQHSTNSQWVDTPSGAATADLVGILGRDLSLLQNSEAAGSNESYLPGSPLACIYKGTVSVENAGSVAAVRGGAVFVVVNTAGGQELGEVRADDDGANSVELAAARAEWVDDVAVGAIGRIRLNMAP